MLPFPKFVAEKASAKHRAIDDINYCLEKMKYYKNQFNNINK